MNRISPAEALDLQKEGWTYLDVRSTPEFERGHPAGAAHVPFLEASPAGLQPNPAFLDQVKARFAPDAKLVVGCEAGGRSLKAAMLLSQAGYTSVVDQRCGFGGARGPGGQVVEPGWRDAGLPVETGPDGA